MNITAISVMRRVSDRLTDQEVGYEFELYTKAQVLAAFNWALAVVAQTRPELFSRPKRVTLQAGDSQVINVCDKITAIVGVYVDGESQIIPADMSRLNSLTRNMFQKCKDQSGRYHISYAGLASDNAINLYPPVPEDKVVELDVLCMQTPVAESEDSAVDVPSYVSAAVEELMLYYLYDIDNESVPNRERSIKHWEVATTLLGGNRARSS